VELKIVSASAVLPILPDAAKSQVEVWRDNDGTACAYGYTARDHHWMHFPDVATFCFTRQTNEVLAMAVDPIDEEVIQDTFYRSVQPMALQVLGQEVLHASAVLMPHGVVALCAVSETGKSTIAYGLSQRGYRLWADDAVAIDLADPDVQALPLPFYMRLRPASAVYFGYNRAATYTISEAASGNWGETAAAALAAIFVLERVPHSTSDQEVTVQQLSALPAFSAVLTHAYCFSLENIERKRHMINHYLDVARRVPIFRIRFSAGLDKLPTILDHIERTVNQGEHTCVIA
jgi:hypothetical protein